MGSDTSKIDLSAQMPAYFVAEPEVTFESTPFLERSLRNIVGGRHSNAVLPFNEFYMLFFDRLKMELDDNNTPQDTPTTPTEDDHGIFDRDLEHKSLFLVHLLKFIVKAPAYALVSDRRNGKWRSRDRRRLKRFISENPEVDLTCYCSIGEAVFYAISECDELYSRWVRKAWMEAYSIFLKQVAFIIIKDNNRKKSRLLVAESDRLEHYLQEIDWSDDHFSDCYSPTPSSPTSSPTRSSSSFLTPTPTSSPTPRSLTPSSTNSITPASSSCPSEDESSTSIAASLGRSLSRDTQKKPKNRFAMRLTRRKQKTNSETKDPTEELMDFTASSDEVLSHQQHINIHRIMESRQRRHSWSESPENSFQDGNSICFSTSISSHPPGRSPKGRNRAVSQQPLAVLKGGRHFLLPSVLERDHTAPPARIAALKSAELRPRRFSSSRSRCGSF